MAGAPEYKVYDRDGRYQAACKEPEAAACLASLYGEGATVRWQHRAILWREGKDGNAGDSYDAAAQTILARKRDYHRTVFGLRPS